MTIKKKYARFSKQSEYEFYQKVNVCTWRGTGGLIPHYSPPVQKVDHTQDKVIQQQEDKHLP